MYRACKQPDEYSLSIVIRAVALSPENLFPASCDAAHLIFWPGRVVSLRTSLITSVKIAVRVATGLDLFSDVLMALLFAPARKEVWVAAHSPAAPPSPFIVKAVVDVIAGGAGSHPKWRHRSGSTVCLQD
jgi:hypothetical protein